MRSNKNLALTFFLLVAIAAVCRVFGFAPQLSMALFAGAVIKDKKWAFAFPIFSMFVCDLVYQVLYMKGITTLPGFYDGQLTNYLLFAGLVIIGFYMRKVNFFNVALFSLIECTVYFIFSNFFVWVFGGGWDRPKTFAGMIECYNDALPFFGSSILSTLVCSGVLFGAYRLLRSGNMVPAAIASK